jgi:hypothetical protein|tara:strand:+ start:4887 stop:5279 length:393 start_codon:yes stop_codon:yes gene_type:complete
MTRLQLIPVTPKKPLGNIPKLVELLTNGVRDQAAEGVRLMSTYPPQPAKSRYRRTGTLRRSWNFALKTGGGIIQAIIQSNRRVAPYNEAVQGQDQAPLFEQIGWKTIKDLDKQIQKDFPKRMQDMINKVF